DHKRRVLQVRTRSDRSSSSILCSDRNLLVLETDSPDIAPAWRARGELNEPAELQQIAKCVAQLRGESTEQLIQATGANVMRVLPRLTNQLQ
ncbi:MAG: TatD family hydrolase, partial [Betaproteobacteria bacterium]